MPVSSIFSKLAGALDTIRTYDPFLRREVLYPAELQAQVVGTAGLEPATSWSRTRRTTKLCYVPKCLLQAGKII